jgi:hypothetical protein
MLTIDSLLLFVFIFSILTTLRVAIQFLLLFKQETPERLGIKKTELIFYGITLSYLITYIIQKV